MTKAQLLFDPPAEREQFGLLPRGRGPTARIICIDSNKGRESRVAFSNPDEMCIDHISCGNLAARQGPGKRTARELTETVVDRHDASMHKLFGNDESAGMGFAFPLMSGGILHG